MCGTSSYQPRCCSQEGRPARGGGSLRPPDGARRSRARRLGRLGAPGNEGLRRGDRRPAGREARQVTARWVQVRVPAGGGVDDQEPFVAAVSYGEPGVADGRGEGEPECVAQSGQFVSMVGAGAARRGPRRRTRIRARRRWISSGIPADHRAAGVLDDVDAFGPGLDGGESGVLQHGPYGIQELRFLIVHGPNCRGPAPVKAVAAGSADAWGRSAKRASRPAMARRSPLRPDAGTSPGTRDLLT